MMQDHPANQVPGNGVGGAELAALNQAYAEAEIQNQEFEPVPDGDYQVNVMRVELTRSKTTDNPMLAWELRIMAPRCEGRRLWRRNMIVTPENLRWLKTDLHICGLDLTSLTDLPSQLHRLLDVKLEVTKRTRGEYDDVYINRRIHLGAGASPGNESASVGYPPF